MGLPVTRKCVEAAIETLHFLAEKECDIEEMHIVLTLVNRGLNVAEETLVKSCEMLKNEFEPILEQENTEKNKESEVKP